MATSGKRSHWIETVESGQIIRESPGINPLNPGPGNVYHLVIPHSPSVVERPIGLGLKGYVSRGLSSPNIRMECWHKPIFSGGSANHMFLLYARMDKEWPNTPTNPFPYVRALHKKASGDLEVAWGRSGPPSIDGSVVTSLTSGDVIGIRFWVKDIDATDSQFYVQYYNGSTWVTVANYLIIGIIGETGHYAAFSNEFTDFTVDDEDWLDDFVLAEDGSVPEPPP